MLCNLIWCTTNSCLLSCDFTIDSYLGFLVCFLYNTQLEAKFSTFRQRFCTNSLKNVLVSEEMDQKLFLTFFVERAPLVWHLPESKSLFFFFFSFHLKYYESYSNWLWFNLLGPDKFMDMKLLLKPLQMLAWMLNWIISTMPHLSKEILIKLMKVLATIFLSLTLSYQVWLLPYFM